MASADDTYVDPSALLKLYLHEPESAAMNAWRGRVKGALIMTHHGRVELVNGICLAAFRQQITPEALIDTLESLDEDLTEGRYRQADVLWRSTLNRAAKLSRDHTRDFGTRSLDVIHVASALELGLKHFLTFDLRQQSLARSTGLRLVMP